MRTPSFAASLAVQAAVLALVGALAVALAGCRSLPPSKPAALWTPEEARGAQIYQLKCARCHYPTTTHGLHGPGLQALTKIKSMPSGAPPTDERLTAGHPARPAGDARHAADRRPTQRSAGLPAHAMTDLIKNEAGSETWHRTGALTRTSCPDPWDRGTCRPFACCRAWRPSAST